MLTRTKDKKIMEQDNVFFNIERFGHEQVMYCYDAPTSLRAIIAIHDTTLGPALGGVRMWHYASEQEALNDVLRLSRAMTFKSSISGLNLGGGKAVIIGDPKIIKTEALLRRFGKFLENLGGKYITSSDVNTGTPDVLEYIAMETDYVTGLPELMGGGGSPAPATAYGTYVGMKAMAKKIYGNENLDSKNIGIQGMGEVGSCLVPYLIKENATITITDIDDEKVKKIASQYKVNTVDWEEIYDLDMHIYAPCALGASLNDNTIPRLKCDIVVGSANNQLHNEDKHSRMLSDRGIAYAPDFLVNAGGLINVYNEYLGDYNREVTYHHIDKIYNICLTILSLAEQEKITSHEAAVRLAEKRITEIGKIKIPL